MEYSREGRLDLLHMILIKNIEYTKREYLRLSLVRIHLIYGILRERYAMKIRQFDITTAYFSNYHVPRW